MRSNRVKAMLIAAFAVGGLVAWVVVPASPDDLSTAVAATAEVAATVAPTTTSTTTTTMAPTTTQPPPRAATLAFTGDLLAHGAVVRAADATTVDGMDFRPLFAEVEPILTRADLAICHMETPIAIDNVHLSGYPVFSGPRAYAEGAKAVGYDGCSTASNHSYDQRIGGVESTLQVFEEVGLTAAGMALSEEQDLEPVIYEVNGIQIAHISATYGLNGFVLPAGKEYLVDLIEPVTIIEEARIAREAGAEFVIVSLHWGNQYISNPSSQQESWMQEILPAAEVDLIIGSHAHVVQPIDKINGEWVVYGLGNFLSNQSASCCGTPTTQDGMIVTVSLDENADGSIEATSVRYVPTWVDRSDGYIIRVADPTLERGDVPQSTLDTLTRSAERTEKVVSSRLGPEDGLFVGDEISGREDPAREEGAG